MNGRPGSGAGEAFLTGQDCQSCGTPYGGPYCGACGERRLDDSQRRLSLLFGQLIEEASSLDNKVLRTLKALLFQPGLLSAKHMQGVRKPYMKPVTLFLVLNVAFFLFSPITDFALPLDNQGMQMYGDHVQGVIDAYLVASGEDFETLAARYDAMTLLVAKSIVILGVPILVPFVWLANPARRFYLIDHTVFALHLYGFVLVWPIFVAAVAALLYFAGLLNFVPGIVATFLILGPLFIYIFLAQRRMYGGPMWLSVVQTAVIMFGLLVSHFVYRYIQFWIVWWQVT